MKPMEMLITIITLLFVLIGFIRLLYVVDCLQKRLTEQDKMIQKIYLKVYKL